MVHNRLKWKRSYFNEFILTRLECRYKKYFNIAYSEDVNFTCWQRSPDLWLLQFRIQYRKFSIIKQTELKYFNILYEELSTPLKNYIILALAADEPQLCPRRTEYYPGTQNPAHPSRFLFRCFNPTCLNC